VCIPLALELQLTQLESHDACLAEPSSELRPGGAAEPTHKLVVVIEDEPDLLEVTSFVLESEGFTVRAARNGREGLELLRSGVRPGLVLLDMMMPVMGGREFLTEIAKYPELHAIPIVVLSADGMTRLPGATAVLRKPIDLRQLVEVAEQHAAASPAKS